MSDFESWVKVSLSGSEDFDKALEGLTRLNQMIEDKLGSAIEGELTSLADQAKAKLLGMPTRGAKHTGLRAKIAAGVKVVRGDEGYEVQATVDEKNMLPIPWGLDVASKGWKHPVFGRTPDVVERGAVPWWSETMKQAQPNLERKLTEKIDEAVHEVFGD